MSRYRRLVLVAVSLSLSAGCCVQRDCAQRFCQPDCRQVCESYVGKPIEEVAVASPPGLASYTQTSTNPAGKIDIEQLPNSAHQQVHIPPEQLPNANLEVVNLLSETTQALNGLNYNWNTACVESGMAVVYAFREKDLYKVKVHPSAQNSLDVEVVSNVGNNQAEAQAKAKLLANDVVQTLPGRLNAKHSE